MHAVIGRLVLQQRFFTVERQGERAFRGTSPERFRQVVLWLLVLTGVVGAIRALWPVINAA